MNHRRGLLLFLLCSALAVGHATALPDLAPGVPPVRGHTRLDDGWRFHRGDLDPVRAISPALDDRSWARVSLPHDYGMDGGYARAHPRARGYLAPEVGWYRRPLYIPATARGKVLRVDFDGVFRDSEVWLNGRPLGRHLSGYTPFSYDITAVAQYGATNLLVVRVDPRQREGWWYEGAGIYRHVWLTTLAPLHVARWGTFVVAHVPGGDRGDAAQADLTIQTTVENRGVAVANGRVVSEIIDPAGDIVGRVADDGLAFGSGRRDVIQHLTVPHPQLWSLGAPSLYRLRTRVGTSTRTTDETTTVFGIRTIRFDPARGFFLNGRHVLIKGTGNHQDFAGVGIAVPDSLQAWRVQQLKAMGCNAWRTAHNPPAPALLDACDQLGMLVMDENRHLSDAYATQNPAARAAEVTAMVRRDRNHPSIVMWSMSNESDLQGSPKGAANLTAMMEVVHRYDTTRPITTAMNRGWLEHGYADVEDLIGVNYHPEAYDAIHQRHPRQPMFASEGMNEKTTRGEYEDAPARGVCSCYHLSDVDWRAVAERSYLAGAYVWSGFDYKGEPNPYGWPAISNNTGLMDVCGFPKDKYFYFESCWSARPMVHLMPDSWNWPGREGTPIRVLAFTNAASVELFLNGRSLGRRSATTGVPLEWQVPYAPGALRAEADAAGGVVATDEVDTTTAPARIILAPARTCLQADGEDAVVVAVSVVDAHGRIVPEADNRVTFQLAGDGRILGVGNGDPADHDPDHGRSRRAFHGRCIVIVAAGRTPGELRLTATSPGLGRAVRPLRELAPGSG